MKISKNSEGIGWQKENSNTNTDGENIDLTSYAKKTDLPTKTSQLTNDSGYLTEHQDISDKADKSEVPTKTSQLTNDNGFITTIPSEYVTETELESKGYLTEHQDISDKADKSYVNTELAKKSDKTHTHSYNDLSDKPAIPSINGLATKKELTDGLATKSDKTHTHDQYLTEHQDISGKANKSEIPTKTSQLKNDSGFITKVPSEYITETELNSKGLATETFVTNKIADSLILTSPNGSKFTIIVSDDGQLSATPYGTNE